MPIKGGVMVEKLTAVSAIAGVVAAIPTIEKYAVRIIRLMAVHLKHLW